MDRVKIGLVGFGTVGESFYRLLSRNAEEFARRLGVAVEVPWVGVRDASKPRKVGPGTRVVQGWREILDDPGVPIVVELAGGAENPLELVRGALKRHKHVITANKAMLSAHGQELFALAAECGVELKFEAAVCGGIPIIKILQESLLGNRVRSLVGIVNGTTNYILTRMSADKLSFADALSQAQKKGFAEADPTLDVSGGDAAQKICLLASIAFGQWITPSQILCEGITSVELKDIEFARDSGFAVKLVAQARMSDGVPMTAVYPALVPFDHPLAGVRDEFNGVLVDSDFLGPSMYEGRGAGGNPTASSVASDLGDLLKRILSRQEPRQFGARLPAARPLAPDRMRSRYYFHFVTANRPGIWALVTGICAETGINIESVHQKWEDKSLPSDLYMLIDEAEESQVRRAFSRITGSDGISPGSHYFRILGDGSNGAAGGAADGAGSGPGGGSA
ncbi:MAG TPA: homoserine dehydrogenase [Spirochaetia bacterium]|nr:homoserine dehydrogenase [Spirochaetia bacterium]